MTGPFDREGACPQCGAPMTFKFAAATAQICGYCRFAVARTDRDLRVLGKVADLVDIPSPFQVGAHGTVGDQAFRIAGRVQYDRAGAPGAPWQELFVEYASGAWSWLAHAQGKWYATTLAPSGVPLPRVEQAHPGVTIAVPGHAPLQVVERGQRRLVSAEGELPFAVQPGVIERYADLSGHGGAFGTVDYGDGTAPPQLFLGRQIDPSLLKLEAGVASPERRQVKTAALACPGCGGAISLAAPDTAERVVCPYCRQLSDVNQGALVALKKLPPAPSEPEIPLGKTGKLRGRDVTCIGFVVRGTTVEGERYRWREYLLWAGEAGYAWLLEEDGDWQFIVSIAPGDVDGGAVASGDKLYAGKPYSWKQSVTAEVEHVLGEFYWKVEVGETVQATEWQAAGGEKLSEERSTDEVVWSHSSPARRTEIFSAFGLGAAPRRGSTGKKPSTGWALTWGLLLLGWLVVTIASCISQANKVVFDEPLEYPSGSTTAALPTDDDVQVQGRTCRDWRDTGVAPPPCQIISAPAPDTAIFTRAFIVPADRKVLQLQLSAPKLDNTWVGADLALINDEDGDVQEASVDLEYWSGYEDGESWSEGSRVGDAWFGRLPAGRYIVRVDPEWDHAKPPPELRLTVISDTSRPLWAGASLLVLLALLTVGSIAWAAKNN